LMENFFRGDFPVGIKNFDRLGAGRRGLFHLQFKGQKKKKTGGMPVPHKVFSPALRGRFPRFRGPGQLAGHSNPGL